MSADRVHPDSLRDRLLCLKEDASALLVREFLIPYLDALQPHTLNNWERYVDQEQFFSLLRLYHRDREDGGHSSSSSRVRKQKGNSNSGSAASEDNEDTVWAYLCDIAASIYSDAEAEAMEEAPEGCLAFSTLRTMAALNTEGVVTGEAQRIAMKAILAKEVLKTGSTVMARSRFVILLQQYTDPTSPLYSSGAVPVEDYERCYACLARLDFEPLAFYLFPERTMHSTVLAQLIDRTHRPPVQQSFITDYCVARASAGYQLLDLVWNLPFIILFLLVVLTYRGINANGFDGYSVFKGVDQLMDTSTFAPCRLWTAADDDASSSSSSNIYSSSTASSYSPFSTAWFCDKSPSAQLRWGDVGTITDVYSYLIGHTGPMLWGAETEGGTATAGSHNVSNVLRAVGAMKIRQLRVLPIEEDGSDDGANVLLNGLYNGVFGGADFSSSSDNNNSSNSSSSSRRRLYGYGPYRKGDLDTAPIAFLADGAANSSLSSSSSDPYAYSAYLGLGGDGASPSSVLMPWDGSVFATCDELNASTAFALNYLSSPISDDRRYGCHGHAVVVPFNATRDMYTSIITSLARREWIDPMSTRALVVEYQLFHPYNGFFVAVSQTFEFTAGGGVTSHYSVVPYYFKDDVSQTALVIAGYAIFVVYFAVLVLRLFVQVFITGSALLSTSSALWACYDAVNYAVLLAGIAVRLTWFTEGGPQSPVWQLEHYPTRYDYTAFLYKTFMTIEAFNIIVCVVGLARYLSFVSWYSTIMRTYHRTASLTLTIGALMVSLTFTFAIAGTVAFGSSIDGYQTVKSAAMMLANVFWGGFDYARLRDDDRFFGFVFFAAFALIAIALLMALYAAVFTNSYMDVQAAESLITANIVDGIMRANSHHLLDGGSAATRIAGFPPLQLVIAVFTRLQSWLSSSSSSSSSKKKMAVTAASSASDTASDDNNAVADGGAFLPDGTAAAVPHKPKSGDHLTFHHRHRNAADRFTFDVYSGKVCAMLLDLLQPNGDALRERPAASVTTRTEAVAELLVLIAQHVSVPTFDPSETDATLYARNPSCSVFDYARQLFGNHLDFTLIMCLYVIIPQEKFAQVGGLSLLDALREHRAWVDDVKGRSTQTSVAEKLQLRIDVMMEEQRQKDAAMLMTMLDDASEEGDGEGTGGGSTAKLQQSIAAAHSKVAALAPSYMASPSPVGVEEARLVASMSHLNRRVLLGILSFALPEHYDDEGNTLDIDRFADIAYSLQGYPERQYPAEKLWADLGIESFLVSRRLQEVEALRAAHAHLRGVPLAELPPPPYLFMRGFIPLFQREYAMQSLGCALDPEEVLEMDVLLRRVANENAKRGINAALGKNGPMSASTVGVHGSGGGHSTSLQHGAGVSSTEGDAASSSVVIDGSLNRGPPNAGGRTAPPSPTNDEEREQYNPNAKLIADMPPAKAEALGGGKVVALHGDSTAAAAVVFSDDGLSNQTQNGYGSASTNPNGQEEEAWPNPYLPPPTHPYVTKAQFEAVWLTVMNSKAPERITHRVFRLMPHGVLDPALFIHYCRSNPLTSSQTSLQGKFAAAMKARTTFTAWITFYVPFMALLLYFVLVGYAMDESIAVSEGIKAALAPRPLAGDDGLRGKNVHLPVVDSLEDIRTFLRTTVSTIWAYDVAKDGISNTSLGLNYTEVPIAATASDAAQPIAGSNYPIGAVRLRQIRQRSDSRSRCDDIFDAYFGESGTRALAFPPTMDISTRLFYASRIGLDYEDIINGACFSSYDKGDREKKLKLYNITHPSFVPNIAMRYTNTSGATAHAMESSYHSGGFIMDIPVTSPKADALSYLEELLLNYYVDRMTRFVVVEVVTYNPNLALNAFSRFGFEITGGGAILPISEVVVGPHKPYSNAVFGVCTALIWVMVAVYLVLIAAEVVHHVATDEALYLTNTLGASVLSLYNHPWHLVDAFVIIGFLVSWGWRATTYGRESIESIDNLKPFSESTFVAASGYGLDDAIAMGQYPSAIERSCVYTKTIRYVEASLILFAFARLYSILASWAPIGTVYSIYQRAAKDLVGLLAMLLCVLVGFSLASMLAFGYSVDALFSFQDTYVALFGAALLQGADGYYPAMFASNPDAAIVFQILLIAVTIFMLYSMVIAVLAGATSAILDGAYDGDQCEEVLASEANALDSLYDDHFEESSDDSSSDDEAGGFSDTDEDDDDAAKGGEKVPLNSTAHAARSQQQRSRRAQRMQHKAYSRARRSTKQGGLKGLLVGAFGWFMTSSLVREPIHLYYTFMLATGAIVPSSTTPTDGGQQADPKQQQQQQQKASVNEQQQQPTVIPYSVLYCSSERGMWASMATWWSDVDTQPPGRATLSGIALLLVAREVREANEKLYARHNEATTGAEIGRQKRAYRRSIGSPIVVNTMANDQQTAQSSSTTTAAPAATGRGNNYAVALRDDSMMTYQGDEEYSSPHALITPAERAMRAAEGELEAESPSRSAFLCTADVDLVGTPERERSPTRADATAARRTAMHTTTDGAADIPMQSVDRITYQGEQSATTAATTSGPAAAARQTMLMGSASTSSAGANATPQQQQQQQRRVKVPAHKARPTFTRRRAHTHLADCDGEDVTVLAMEAENERILLGLPTLPSALTQRHPLTGSVNTNQGSRRSRRSATRNGGDDQNNDASFVPSAPLETYGTDRRILSWAEYLHVAFGAEYGTMQRHCITTPNGVKALWYAGVMSTGDDEDAAANTGHNTTNSNGDHDEQLMASGGANTTIYSSTAAGGAAGSASAAGITSDSTFPPPLPISGGNGALADDANNNNALVRLDVPTATNTAMMMNSDGTATVVSNAGGTTSAPVSVLMTTTVSAGGAAVMPAANGGALMTVMGASSSSSRAAAGQRGAAHASATSRQQTASQEGNGAPTSATSPSWSARLKAALLAAASVGATASPATNVALWRKALATNNAHCQAQKGLGMGDTGSSAASIGVVGPAAAMVAGNEDDLLLLELCARLPSAASNKAKGDDDSAFMNTHSLLRRTRERRAATAGQHNKRARPSATSAAAARHHHNAGDHHDHANAADTLANGDAANASSSSSNVTGQQRSRKGSPLRAAKAAQGEEGHTSRYERSTNRSPSRGGRNGDHNGEEGDADGQQQARRKQRRGPSSPTRYRQHRANVEQYDPNHLAQQQQEQEHDEGAYSPRNNGGDGDDDDYAHHHQGGGGGGDSPIEDDARSYERNTRGGSNDRPNPNSGAKTPRGGASSRPGSARSSPNGAPLGGLLRGRSGYNINVDNDLVPLPLDEENYAVYGPMNTSANGSLDGEGQQNTHHQNAQRKPSYKRAGRTSVYDDADGAMRHAAESGRNGADGDGDVGGVLVDPSDHHHHNQHDDDGADVDPSHVVEMAVLGDGTIVGVVAGPNANQRKRRVRKSVAARRGATAANAQTASADGADSDDGGSSSLAASVLLARTRGGEGGGANDGSAPVQPERLLHFTTAVSGFADDDPRVPITSGIGRGGSGNRRRGKGMSPKERAARDAAEIAEAERQRRLANMSSTAVNTDASGRLYTAAEVAAAEEEERRRAAARRAANTATTGAGPSRNASNLTDIYNAHGAAEGDLHHRQRYLTPEEQQQQQEGGGHGDGNVGNGSGGKRNSAANSRGDGLGDEANHNMPSAIGSSADLRRKASNKRSGGGSANNDDDDPHNTSALGSSRNISRGGGGGGSSAHRRSSAALPMAPEELRGTLSRNNSNGSGSGGGGEHPSHSRDGSDLIHQQQQQNMSIFQEANDDDTGRGAGGANNDEDPNFIAVDGDGSPMMMKMARPHQQHGNSEYGEEVEVEGADPNDNNGRRKSAAGGGGVAKEFPSAVDIIKEANDYIDENPNEGVDAQAMMARRRSSGGRSRQQGHDRHGADDDVGADMGGSNGSRPVSASRRRKNSGKGSDGSGDSGNNQLALLTGDEGTDHEGGESRRGEDRQQRSPSRRKNRAGNNNAGDPEDDDFGGNGNESPARRRRKPNSALNTSGTGNNNSRSQSTQRTRKPPRSNSANLNTSTASTNNNTTRGGLNNSRPGSPQHGQRAYSRNNSGRNSPAHNNSTNGNGNGGGNGSPYGRFKRDNSPHGQYFPDDYLSPKERHSHWLPSGKAEIPDLRRMMADREERLLQKQSLQGDGYSPSGSPSGSLAGSPTHGAANRSSRPQSPTPTYGL